MANVMAIQAHLMRVMGLSHMAGMGEENVGRIDRGETCESRLSSSLLLLDGIRKDCPIPQFIIDRSHRVIFWNKALEQYSGIKAEDILGTAGQWRPFYASERPVLADLLADGAIEEIPRWYQDKCRPSKLIEGAYEATDFFSQVKGGTWLYFTASPITDPEGNIRGAIETLEDVTELKRVEASLRRSENLLSEGEWIAKWGAWDWDIERDRLFCSRGLERILGLLEGCPLSLSGLENDVICPGDQDAFQGAVKRAILNDVPLECDLSVKKQDGSGEIRVLHVRGAVKKDKAGRPKLIIGTAHDITERKRAEESLKEAKAQAELYLDLMGHDINNMNQASLGYLELAMAELEKKCDISDRDRNMVQKAVEALQKSSRLIGNIRKIQASMAGEARLSPVDLGKTLSAVVAHYSNVPGRSITIHYRPEGGQYVRADELLFDVFSNIIGNAIMHSPDERALVIDLGVAAVDRNGAPYYRVTIADNGPGISDARKGEVFGSRSPRTMGHGIGLFLVKTLVDNYGGYVWVEDRVKGDHTKGALLVVLLPAIEK